jgi:hypothetical protein
MDKKRMKVERSIWNLLGFLHHLGFKSIPDGKTAATQYDTGGFMRHHWNDPINDGYVIPDPNIHVEG